jgi:hypothetical protein
MGMADEEKRAMRCEVCGRWFPSRAELETHLVGRVRHRPTEDSQQRESGVRALRTRVAARLLK